MSYIQGNTTPAILARFDGTTDLEADATTRQFLRSIIQGLTVVAPSLSAVAYFPDTVFAGSTAIDAFGRLNADPNVFGAAVFAGSTAFAATGRLILDGSGVIAGSTAFAAAENSIDADTAELLIFADLVPAAVTGANTQILGARLYIDGLAVPIKRFRYSAPAGAAGVSFSATLAKPIPSQAPLTGDFVFEIYYEGSWLSVFSGSFGSRSYSIAFDGDQVDISSIDDAADRLGKAPKTPTVFYDPSRIETLTEDAGDVLSDTLGNRFPTNFVATAGLDLYDLFDYAFKTVCGFSAWRSNIPNFRISRADFPIGRPVLETVRGVSGMFEPLFFERSGTLWIIDATLALPAGFAPRAIADSRFLAYQAETGQDAGNVDGIEVTFAENSTGDFYTQRFETDIETVGNIADSNYIAVTTEREFFEYRTAADPATILRTVLKSESRTTTNGAGATIGAETTTFDFDTQGRATGYVKTVDSLVPDLSLGGSLVLQRVREERQRVEFSTDSLGRTRIYNRSTAIEGLVAIDSENQYFGADYKQDFLDAHGAGNLNAEMTTSFEPIRTIVDRFSYLNNGQTSVSTTTIDHLRGGLTRTNSDAAAGESLITARQKSRRMIVWRDGFDHSSPDLSQRQIRSLNAGELPPKLFIPLAKRKLARAVAGKGSGRVLLSGFDASIRRGSTFRIVSRSDASLGDYLTLGFDIAGENLGTAAASIKTDLAMLEI